MANTYETIIIILAMALNTGIILWFITNYNDTEFGGNPTLLNINYNIVVPIFFVLISFLLISKVPTLAFKKISIPRRMTIFALFGVVLFFGLLLIYTFKVLVICSLVYICLIPFGYFNYQKINKQKVLNDENNDNDELEDIL